MNYYESVRASLLSFTKGLAEELQLISPEITNIDFDTFSAPGLLPENDVVGPFQYDIADEGQVIWCRTIIMVSTIKDINLFRLNKMVGAAYSKLRPDMTIPFLDAETGEQLGHLYVQPGTQVLPLDSNAPRPMKAIAVSLGSTVASG